MDPAPPPHVSASPLPATARTRPLLSTDGHGPDVDLRRRSYRVRVVPAWSQSGLHRRSGAAEAPLLGSLLVRLGTHSVRAPWSRLRPPVRRRSCLTRHSLRRPRTSGCCSSATLRDDSESRHSPGLLPNSPAVASPCRVPASTSRTLPLGPGSAARPGAKDGGLPPRAPRPCCAAWALPPPGLGALPLTASHPRRALRCVGPPPLHLVVLHPLSPRAALPEPAQRPDAARECPRACAREGVHARVRVHMYCAFARGCDSHRARSRGGTVVEWASGCRRALHAREWTPPDTRESAAPEGADGRAKGDAARQEGPEGIPFCWQSLEPYSLGVGVIGVLCEYPVAFPARRTVCPSGGGPGGGLPSCACWNSSCPRRSSCMR